MLKKSILNYQKFPSFDKPKLRRGHDFFKKIMSTPSENDKVRQILQSVVATSSRKLYNPNNVNMLLWIYKNPLLCSQLVAPWIIPLLDAANEQEIILHAKGSFRKDAKDAIEAMAPDLEKSLILLENINFEIFSKFIISKKQSKSRQQQQYKRRKCRRLIQNTGEEQGNMQQDELNLTSMSKSTYDGYQSALAHLYWVSNISMPDVMAKKIITINGWDKENDRKRKTRIGDKK